MLKYAIHPGIVERDNQRHYITSYDLARFYRIHPSDWIPWHDDRPETYAGYRYNDFIHIYYDGRLDWKMSIDTHFKVLLYYMNNRNLLEKPFNKEELFYLDNWFDTNIPIEDLCIYLVHDLEWVRMFAKRSMDRRK
jgi:hypothetical protein